MDDPKEMTPFVVTQVTDRLEVVVRNIEEDIPAVYAALQARVAHDLKLFRMSHRPHEAVTGSVAMGDSKPEISIESPDDETVYVSRFGDDETAFIVTLQMDGTGLVTVPGGDPQVLEPDSTGVWHLMGVVESLQAAIEETPHP